MNVILDTKDIRFSDSKINILLRGGVVTRDVLRNSANNIIDMYDVPFGVAKRINDITAIDVREDKELNNWYHIVCGDTKELAAVYSKKTDTEEIEVSFSCDPKLSEEAKEAMPISACGTTLSIAATVKSIVCDGISNWINFVRTKQLSKLIMHNAFKYQYLNM